MQKFVYEKPMSVDAGKIASVLGAMCSTGYGAGQGECVSGVDPNMVPACTATGANATNNCENNGESAQQNCNAEGQTASVACQAGGSPAWCNSGSSF